MNIDEIIEEFTDDFLSEISRKQTHISNGCFGELDYSNGEREGFEKGLYFFRDEILKKIKDDKNLALSGVSNRYFVFSGQEDNKPTKYLVDDCKDRETAIVKIETEYPNFKWVMTETFNGC